jgi:PAS domain S-box-containing protein
MRKTATSATIVDYIYNADRAFEEKRSKNFKRESEQNLILPLRVITLLIAVSGLFAMIFEVRHFTQFAVQVYFTRLTATLISFLILWLLYSRYALKFPILLVHVLLLTIISSSAYMILLMPSTLIVNTQIVGLMIFTSALFLSWDLKHQIIVAIYYNLVFAASILLNDKRIYFLPNMYESVLFVIFLSVISVIGSSVNYKLRTELADKSFRVKLSERKFRSIFEHSAEGIFQSSPDGHFLTANTALIQMLGYNSEEDLKRINITDDLYVKPSDRDKLLTLLQHKGEIANYRLQLKKKDNTRIMVRVNERIVKDEQDAKTYFEGSIADITEQVKLEEDQERIQEELKLEKMKSDKLAKEAVKSSEIKSQFLANMSHEIRTPINGILGFLTFIENGQYKDTAELNDFISSAKSSAESLLDLVNDVLDFSKIEAGKMELDEIGFNIAKVVNDATSVIVPRLTEKGLNLIIDIDRHIPAVLLGDSIRLRQIFINLLSNAEKFTQKGDITVKVVSEKIAIDKVKLQCTVKDSGVGIAPEKIAQLFKPFSQVDGSYTRKFGGTGLGLVISRELVNMMNGSIWVESEVGHGSAFSFTCVLKFERQTSFLDKLKKRVNPTPGKAIETNPNLINNANVKFARQRYRILVAEDNSVNMKVVLKILESAGFVADPVNNGLEALQAVSADQQKYNLILMDVQMPEMDGFTATQNIRLLNKQTARLPIIALTAHATSNDREKCLAAGMNDYLTKPIKNTELIALLDKWLEVDYSVASSVPDKPTLRIPDPKPVWQKPVEKRSQTITPTAAFIPVPDIVQSTPVQFAKVERVPETVNIPQAIPKIEKPVEKSSEIAIDKPTVAPELPIVAPELPIIVPELPIVTATAVPAVTQEPGSSDIAAFFDVEHFKSVSLDDPEFKVDLLTTYVDDTLKRITQLGKHILDGNFPSIISEGHTIKGASYSVGAKAMGDQAKEIEFAGKRGETANLQGLYDELRKRYDQLAAVKNKLLEL